MQNNPKKIRCFAVIIALIMTCAFLVSCTGTKNLPKPDDFTLDFWLLDDVTDTDISEFFAMEGRFGCIEILGRGYEAEINEENHRFDYPEYYVSYILTPYPDYASQGLFVTQIIVADPDVTLYGLSINSSVEEFDAVFEEMGFELSNLDFHDDIREAKKGRITVRFRQGVALSFMAEVTNDTGIMF